MKLEEREIKTVTEKGTLVQWSFLTYRCPKPSCTVEIVSFKDNNGFQNPCANLRSCNGKRKTVHAQEALLDEIYGKAKVEA